jgi:uncharacterized protein (DUF2336 family)
MTPSSPVIDEIEGALRSGPPARGVAMLRQVASLFVDLGMSLTAEQIDLFDQVLSRLADGIEAAARADLAGRLNAAGVAPPRLLRQLVLDDLIDVAGPLLSGFDQLDDAALVECANTRGQGHMLAISRRHAVSAVVTDHLVIRGETPVLLAIAENAGAHFSEAGFATLVRRAEGDDALASSVGIRADLPRHHFLRLLSAASDIVRERLEAADPQNARDIQAVVTRVSDALAQRIAPDRRQFADATRRAQALRNSGTLGDREILQFLADGKLEDAIAAVAVLADLDAGIVDEAMRHRRPETLLTILKAVGLGWPTAKGFLQAHGGDNRLPTAATDHALASFARLNQETARQVLHLRWRRPPDPGGATSTPPP